MGNSVIKQLPSVLLPWYREHGRALPWRQSREPYRIWLSEIMLQQTRVEAVKGYYARFLEALPTVEVLAKADDELLHKLWQGLGYYSRARNLKKAAVQIVEQYNGIFPVDYEQVLALPGIGEYTAGAICSIAFDQPKAAVDGNVLRVITRLTEDVTPIDSPTLKRSVREALEEVYPKEAGAFTQALMELGATLCGPNWKPRCTQCPCRNFCGGYLHGTAEQFPVKKPKAKRREEQYTVFIVSCEGRFALEKRPAEGLLAGLPVSQLSRVSGTGAGVGIFADHGTAPERAESAASASSYLYPYPLGYERLLYGGSRTGRGVPVAHIRRNRNQGGVAHGIPPILGGKKPCLIFICSLRYPLTDTIRLRPW